MLVPLYIAEMSPPSIRGRLVGIYEIGVQAGTCVGFWISYGVAQNVAPTSAQWQIPFAIQLLPGCLLVLGMFFLPESPRWIARSSGREIALEALAKLRNLPTDHEYVLEETYRIMDQIEQERIASGGKSGPLANSKSLPCQGTESVSLSGSLYSSSCSLLGVMQSM